MNVGRVIGVVLELHVEAAVVDGGFTARRIAGKIQAVGSVLDIFVASEETGVVHGGRGLGDAATGFLDQ